MNTGVTAIDRQVHITFDGTSHDLSASQLDIGDASTDEQIKTAVADFLGAPVEKLRSYVVERNTESGSITVHPNAVLGS